jgi:hypothetical protein
MENFQRKTLEQFKKDVYDKYGDEFTVMSTEYLTRHEGMMQLKHNVCGFDKILKQSNKILDKTMTPLKLCPVCNPNGNRTNRKDIIEFKLNKIRPDLELLNTEEEIANMRGIKKLKVKCKNCGIIEEKTYVHLVESFQRGHNGCLNCKRLNGEKTSDGKNFPKRYTEEEIKQYIYEQVGNEYELISPYINDKKYVTMKHNYRDGKYHIYKVPMRKFKEGCRCPYCTGQFSKNEKEILKFIESFYTKTIINNTKRVLSDRKELDIYLPDDKIAIEYNGLFWHSEEKLSEKALFQNYPQLLAKNYHLMKTEECERKGIRLIHIFENDWENNQEIIKSKLKHILGCNQDLPKIFARKCEIKVIDIKTKDDFLNKNHIQGADKSSSVLLGLYYNDILCAVMTFFVSNKKNTDNIEYNLSRYASDNNYVIIGGFSKLLKYFERNYEWNSIITYADRTWSIGDLYDKNGFIKEEILPPDYKYYRKSDESFTLYHKFDFRKERIKNKFPEIYDENKTEKEMMQEAGYVRIWNCGLIKYRLINTNQK